MICPNPKCNAAIPDGLVYCPSCGEPLQVSSRVGPVNKSLWPYVAALCALIFIAATAVAVACREQIKEILFPPVCEVHTGVRLVNGECPKKCPDCGAHLDKDGKCVYICPVHGVHKVGGECPEKCPDCGAHLDKDGNCVDICPVHGVHKVGGECPKKCPDCGAHLDKDGNCVDICPVHGVHKVDGECPKKCKICGKHLEKDGGKRCLDTCDKHPTIHLLKGLCRWCNPDYVDLDEGVRVHKETERAGRFYPEFSVGVGKGVSTDRSEVNWILDDNDVGHGNLVPDGTSSQDGTPRKIWIWAPEEGFAPDETHVIQAITWRNSPDGPLLSRARPYTWTKKPAYCDTHKDTLLDKDGKCPKCAEESAAEDALATALAAFREAYREGDRSPKWKEGVDAISNGKVPESKIEDKEFQFYCGYCHEGGLGGASKDIGSALRWYRASADKGHVEAQYRLGRILVTKKYRPFTDEEEGMKWLERAAAQGHKTAFYLLKDLGR